MKLSVVSTLYKSRIFLDVFLIEIIKTIKTLDIDDFELIFVNDGSPDDSLKFLLEKKENIPQIVLLDLSRNFGHHNAIQIGLQYSKGDFIFLIDNDLEVPPSFLSSCFRIIEEQADVDVVYGYQEKRRGGIIEKFGGSVFWWMINKLSETKIPNNITPERLMSRNYLNSLLQLGDANMFLGGMMYWTGYNQIGIPVEKGVREGESTYSTRKRIELMLEAITSFSGKPLEFLFYFGILITFLSIMFIFVIFIRKFFLEIDIQLGWTSIIAINVLILGIISTFLGLIGIYIFRIFKQVQNRPNAIIKKIYE